MNYKEAREQILLLAKDFKNETISLDDAYGRVLAEKIIADRDYPPFNRATMDGYAINYEDFNNGVRTYTIAATIYAGQYNTAMLQPGACYKIMTGASVPLDANLVIRKEDVALIDQHIRLSINSGKAFQNIAKQGEDIKSGTTVIGENILCTPAVISLLAALGKYQVVVGQLPIVSVFTTGNEIVSIDKSPIATFEIRNSNQYQLKNLLKEWHIHPQICEHIKDDKEALTKAFSKALNSDIIIVNGAVSAGDTDFVPEVLTNIGVNMLFHKVAIRPGKPFWCGVLPNGGLVFALPGNPFSCMVTYNLFIKPYLRACFGLPQKPVLRIPLLHAKMKKVSLDEFFSVRLQADPIGLKSLQFNTSGDIKAPLFADGIALHPLEIETLEEGLLVDYLPFGN